MSFGSGAFLRRVTIGRVAATPRTIGRYELLEPIGQGGMGTVYRARDPMIDRLVAIKTIDFSDAGDAASRRELRERVLREASAAGALSHPNIVTVHDVGELDSKAYIVMEYVDGVTLWQLRESGEAPSHARVVEILRETAAALDYAHSRGIIHRDVKPGNIMIARDGRVKITDFGIARMLSGERLTKTGMIVGTPHYMAPEQLGTGEVGPPADQFALAINAYEALTGRKPFDADNFSKLLAMILKEQPPPLRSIDPSIPAAVDSALRRSFAKDPAKRYPSCSALGEALSAAFGTSSPTVRAASPPQRRSRLPLAAWVAGGVAATAVALWLAFSGGGAGPGTRGGEPGGSPVAAVSRGADGGTGAADSAVPQGPNTPEPGSGESATEASQVAGEAQEPAGTAAPATAAVATPGRTVPGEQASGGRPKSGASPVSPPQGSSPPGSSPGSSAPGSSAPVSSAAAASSGQPSSESSPSSQRVPPASPNAAPQLVPLGPLVTLVWKGELGTSETLVVDGGKSASGELSRPLPAFPMQVEISPQDSLELVEAPSAANNWSRLRIHNSGRARTLIFIRYRKLAQP